ncbi:MAG TPA: hypothetical protein VFX51_02785 [Solirubrobacteraceae bacterium]|nr:hypothetical protein [Solirubrobacteraceae bacterium]
MSTTQRPASRRPLSPLTRDSSLGAVIAEFMRATDSGADRELRAALTHVDAELGTMPVRTVRPRHLTALLEDLREAGLSPRREALVVEALHAVFAFAVARGLVAADPTPDAAPRRAAPQRAAPPDAAPPEAATAPSPTFAMLALGARLAFWTTWLIMVGFLVLLLVLLLELG